MIETALRARLDPAAVVQQFGYFFPSIRAQGLRIAWNAETLAGGMKTIERLCSLVAGGAFPATDDADDCRYCDYAAICGDVKRVADQSKALLDQDDLAALLHYRELRRG